MAITSGTLPHLDPNDPRVLIRSGSALQRAGRLQEAADVFWQALAIVPLLLEARLHLGNTLAQIQRQLAATAQVLEADVGVQREVERLIQSAEASLGVGQSADALTAFARAGRLWPYSAELHSRIGAVLWELSALEEALVHYDLAARFRPNWPEAFDHAGTLAAALGLAERAKIYLGATQQMQPSDPLSLRLALVLPAIEDSSASVLQTRQRYEEALDRLLDTPQHIPYPFQTAQLASFYLAYHGESNRAIHSKLAQVFLRASPELTWTASHVREPRRSGARIKIGLISHFMKNHSIGKTTRGLVAQLSREQFEVYVINLPPVPEDEIAVWIRNHADHCITVDQSLEAARVQIAALELDILFYQDIGMEPFGYYLAYSRLARVQCVSYGHPDTTGIPNIDYFISNDLYELAESEQDYSERLFLLQDLPTLSYYYRPAVPKQGASRAHLGFDETEHIYLCPQTLFKIHPEFDHLLADILRRDPQGRVVLVRGHCEQWRVKLAERFRRVAPDVAQRIVFIPERPLPEFIQLLRTADVILDTIHFNGMNSSLEALAVGTPVVTLPKALQRGRHTQAMYRKMEIPDCVAEDERGYVDIAVRIGSDRGYRGLLQRTILERSTVLYENSAVTREFERFFVNAVREAGCS
jgi:protein O-GlcNAc transferase